MKLDGINRQFWKEMDGLLREIPTSEKIFLEGDLNWHVGKDDRGYKRVHGGEKNELRDTILDFALAFDLVIANTCFKKIKEHLIT